MPIHEKDKKEDVRKPHLLHDRIGRIAGNDENRPKTTMDIFSAVNLFVQERRCSPVLTAGRCAPPPSVLVECSCRQTKNVETSSGKNRRIVLPIPRTRLRMEQSPPFWTTPRQSTPPLAASHTSAAKSKPRTPDRNHTADPEKPTKHPPAPEDDDGHFFRRQSLRAGTSVQSCIDGRSLRTPAFRACGTFLQADEKRRNVQREEPQNRPAGRTAESFSQYRELVSGSGNNLLLSGRLHGNQRLLSQPVTPPQRNQSLARQTGTIRRIQKNQRNTLLRPRRTQNIATNDLATRRCAQTQQDCVV